MMQWALEDWTHEHINHIVQMSILSLSFVVFVYGHSFALFKTPPAGHSFEFLSVCYLSQVYAFAFHAIKF